MALPVSFTTADDGVRIAYTEAGAGPPLLLVRGWITHLELMWAEPSFRRFFTTLAERFRVIRYDARGNGLSERGVLRPELDDLVSDVEAVVDTLALEPCVLWGSCFGGPIAIAYAARHPDRVSHLVLEGTYPTWVDHRSAEQRRAAGDLMRMLGSSPPMASTAISFVTDPEPGTRHEQRSRRILESIDPQYLAYLYGLAARVDVRDDVERLRVPTLVMHARGSQVYPPEGAQLLAATIRSARYVELAGVQHNPWEGDGQTAIDAVCELVGVGPAPVLRTTTERLAVIMFTDLVSSTDVADRLGDAAAAGLRRAHDRIVTGAVVERGGTIVKHTGDGVLAEFSTASSALAAAGAIVDAARAHNVHTGGPSLEIRVGLNAGEPTEESGDLHGAAVNLAARVCAAAPGNTVFVTAAVRHLAAGKGFAFDDEGTRVLKGFAEPVRLYRLGG